MSYTWNDTILPDRKIEYNHINEIRKYIDVERNIRNFDNYNWTDDVLSENSKIKSIHIKELRNNIELIERIRRCISHNITIDNTLFSSYDNEHDISAYDSLYSSVDDNDYNTVYNKDYKAVEDMVDSSIFITAKNDHNNNILNAENSNNDETDKDSFRISNNIIVCGTHCNENYITDLVDVNKSNHITVKAVNYKEDKISDNDTYDNNEKTDFNLNVT